MFLEGGSVLGSPFWVLRSENGERRTENRSSVSNDRRPATAAARQQHDEEHQDDERQDADRDPYRTAIPTAAAAAIADRHVDLLVRNLKRERARWRRDRRRGGCRKRRRVD